MLKKLPLNCPFCDEETYQEERTRRVVTPYRIYTLRQCIMGHEVYSVEEIPENQNEIVKEVRAWQYAKQQQSKEQDD